MIGPRRRIAIAATALCVAAQGAALSALARGGALASGGALAAVGTAALLAAAAAVAAAAGRRGTRARPFGRRTGLLVVAVAQAGLLALGIGAWAVAHGGGDRGAPARERAALAAALDRAGGLPAGLLTALDAAGAAATAAAEPARALAVAEETWRRADTPWRRFPLAAVIWQDGERVAWGVAAAPLPAPRAPAPVGAAPPANAMPGTAPPAPSPEGPRSAAPWGQITRGPGGWFWRRFHVLPAVAQRGAVLELQLRLTPDELPTGAVPPPGGDGPASAFAPRAGARTGAWTAVVGEADAHGAARFESAGGRLSGRRDLRLPDPDEGGRPVWLRLTIDRSAGAEAAEKQGAARLALALLLWGAAVAGGGWALGGGWGLLAGLAAARLLWSRADLLRWLAAAGGAELWPAGPGSLASLLDPAYFATPAGGGLLASTADSLLTVALGAACAMALALRLDRPATAGAPDTPGAAGVATAGGASPGGAFPGGASPGGASPGRALPGGALPGSAFSGSAAPAGRPAPRAHRLAVALVAGAAAAGAFLALHWFVGTVAENANPRLIGPRIPYRTLPFWALHLTLLIASGSLLVLLLAGARRLRRRAAGVPGALGVALGVALVAGPAPGLAPSARLLLPLLALLLWWAARFGRLGEAFPRRLAQLVPLLAAVLWNYAALGRAYGRAELVWLERKGQEIVQPQDDWIRFLVADTLAEMAAGAAAAQVSPAAPAQLAAGLWRNWLAYDLWRRSALRDLGLPCLVDIRDGGGASASLYAAGFFRDFGYEVVARGEWTRLAATPTGRELPGTVFLQPERRRYASGEELILRGEIARADAPGWIQLELPVASRRIATLMARLSGEASAAVAGGYLPRTEIDRSLLLVRGDDRGWLDAGAMPFPEPESAAVVDDLRAGRRLWGVVRAGGADYRCLWRAASVSGEARADGAPPPPGKAGAPASDTAGLGVPGEGFLLGIEVPGLGARLLDVSRLALLDLLLLAGLVLPWFSWRLARRRRHVALGFQERFLAACLGLGLVPLVLAGVFVDRLNLQLLANGARDQARQGLEAAVSQLQGLLAEQARALAQSEYIAGLLASRLAGQRPLGPFAARQGMLFDADGHLLLDETLSDLDAEEAATLLAKGRSAPLVVWEDEEDLFLGLIVPVDLGGADGGGADSGGAEGGAPEGGGTNGGGASGGAPEGDAAADAGAPGGDAAATAPARSRNGFFFYRQRVDADLLVGLAEIIQGEVTLRVGGEVVLASHPERVFSGATPLLLPAAAVAQLQRYPNSPLVAATAGRLGYTGTVALPAIAAGEASPQLRTRRLPATLTVGFPARERDFTRQREQMVLFLMGLATFIFLLAALLGLLLTWRIFGPLRVLVTATRRLAAGDFAAPLPEEGRHEVGILSGAFRTMRDDLARTQRELARRQRFLATVLERVPVGVAIFNPDGEVAALNPAAALLLSEDPAPGAAAPAVAEWPGVADAPVAVAADVAARARRLREAFQARLAPAAQGEAELRAADGRRTLRGRLAPLRLPEGGDHELLVFEDVTEFLDTKRLALQAELARQVAHEIKNPLTPIQLSMQFLEQAHRDRAPQLDRIVQETVRQVLAQVALLREIATEFSLLGRPGALAVAPVAWPELARGVIDRYRAGEEGPRVDLSPETVPPVLAHAESLAKVMSNLMENSLQACAAPARLALRVRWRADENAVTMLWEDNGPGLPDEVAARLFQPYFSTKSQGTGLGLAICRNLLDRMGGTITLRNRDDGPGAVAEVTLPRAVHGSG